MLNLSQWLTKIAALHPKTMDLGLARMAEVANSLGCHTFDIPVVTIGGTNGKGSCVRFIEMILLAAGFNVGVYTSPHLLQYNERVRINGSDVDDATLCTAFTAIEAARAEVSLTYFEFGTLAALYCFKTCNVIQSAKTSPSLRGAQRRGNLHPNGSAVSGRSLTEFTPMEEGFGMTGFHLIQSASKNLQQTCTEVIHPQTNSGLDIILLEVGLGGRLDAVNIVDADISVITSIDFDHMDWLGDTREKIGYEKAGIFRAGKPAICGDYHTPESVRQYAHDIKAEFYQAGQEFDFIKQTEHWRWWSDKTQLDALPLPQLLLQNASTALMAVDLIQTWFTIPEAAIQQGLQIARLPGRFQCSEEGEFTQILDVAHNPHAANALATRIQALPRPASLRAVVAMLGDKDQKGTLQPLIGLVNTWYVAGLDVPRGSTAASLAAALESLGESHYQAYTTVEAAYQSAKTDCKTGDYLLIFGSFHTVAEVLHVQNPV